MPELRDRYHKLTNFTPTGPEKINIHSIKFKDKTRERARQKRLTAELEAGGKSAKQVKAETRAAEMEVRKKERRAAEIAKGRNPKKKKGRQQQIFDEWDELAKEERLHKKLKMGKITKDEFKRQMHGDRKGKDATAETSDDSD